MSANNRFFQNIGIFVVLIAVFIGFSGHERCFSDTYRNPRAQREAGLNFFLDIVTVDSPKPDMSRINIYVKIAYDELQFVVIDSIFQGGYELSIVIFDENGNQIDGKLLQESFSTDSYEKTNSKNAFVISHASFDLKPDKYNISIGITDDDTKKSVYQRLNYKIEAFGKKDLEVSDVTIVNNITLDSLGIKSIRPEIASYIHEKQRMLYGYYEVYSKRNVDSFRVSYKVRNSRGTVISEGEKPQPKDGQRTMAFVDLDASKLSHGNYTLVIEVDDGKKKVESKKRFVVRWIGIPEMIVDIDLAIEQLKYIASPSDMKKLQNSEDDQKISEFEKFWNAHDPTPGTDVNEHMDEYYGRINYSNENFSGFKEGWRSDMGMIYIIYGPPDDIERHPFESDYKPYEIWYYNQMSRHFVFIDESGFGEYRLSTESWYNWQNNLWR